MNLNQKKLLITGGTSRLGASFVRKALSLGADVSFTYFQNSELSNEFESLGAKGYVLDLCSQDSVQTFIKKFAEDNSELDVLIHNAAVIRDFTIKNMSEGDWDTVLDANLKRPAFITQKLLALLKENQSKTPAKVFFITSRVAVQGAVGVSNYAAAKAGLIGLTKSWAKEWDENKVLVNAVNPGFMQSAMTQDLPEQVLEKNLKANPLGDYSNPEEVTGFLAYLCSDEMKQVTGQVFHFESRWTA